MANIKVKGYQILAPSPIMLGSPGIRCLLEGGDVFDMGGIPFDVALAIEKLANGNDLTDDVRLVLPVVLSQLPEIEVALGKTVKEVVIDTMQPRRTDFVYGATVTLEINGESTKRLMVPSSAIVLALLAGVDVYVDEKFLKGRDVNRYIS